MAVPGEALRAARLARSCFGDSLSAVYLCGSAAAGGLHPSSDVDLLVVAARPMTQVQREVLLDGLMNLSGPYPVEGGAARPVELIVFLRREMASPSYPCRSEFVYGEWLRKSFEAGKVSEPESNPDFTLLLAQARQHAIPLIGPDPAALLPVVAPAEIKRAIADSLPVLLDSLNGDERNVVLTLARMWRTLTTDEFVAKDVAAEWAVPRLTGATAAVVAHARNAYLGIEEEDWQARRDEAASAAGDLRERIAALV